MNGSDLHFRMITGKITLIAVWRVDLRGWVKRGAGGDGGLNLGRTSGWEEPMALKDV